MEEMQMHMDKRGKISAAAFNSAAGRPVRVIMPASVAFDLDRFQSAMANLAERLGCKPCLSGAACTFMLEQDFVINPATLEAEGFGD